MDFSEIKISSKNYTHDESKPGSKTKRLKRMLQESEEKRIKLEELKASGLEGIEKVKADQWSDAIMKASGEKTLDDSKKLKKALKRIENKKKKSSEEWQVILILTIVTHILFTLFRDSTTGSIGSS
jgi:hypothetical protein